MRKPFATAASHFTAISHAACAATGLVLGQLVLALALREPGSATAVWAALVMSLSGGAAVALLLGHWHNARLAPGPRWRGTPPPMQSWLLTMSAAALAAMAFNAGP